MPDRATAPASDVARAVPAASAARAAFLEQAGSRSPLVPKAEFVVAHCQARDVLDVGCINHSADVAVAMGEDWLHRRIQRVARSVTGLDILAADAEALNRRGFDVVVADAQDFDLGRTFDVVVGGDIIEHLSDIGGFLRSARRHMTAESLLVLTTPNPFNFAQMMQVLLRGQAVVNAEHTVWIDPSVMHELLDREGLVPLSLTWIDSDPGVRPASAATRALQRTADLVGRVRPMTRANYGVVARIA